MAELFTMQRYLQYDDLKARGIVHFDAWASTFGQVVVGWELDATGVNYRLNSRFAKFQNVPELMALYRSFADVVSKEDLHQQAQAQGLRFPVPKLKGGRPQNVVVERSTAQAHFMGIQTTVLDDAGQPVLRSDGLPFKAWNQDSIIWRMENLPQDPRLDNPLKITNEARKAGLDFRLVDPSAADHEGSKVNAAVQRVFEIWQAWRDRKGAQLVFCDLSTPKATSAKASAMVSLDTPIEDENSVAVVSMDELLAQQSSFSVYDDLRAKLIQRGVPEQAIRFVHDAKTDAQKAKLFQEVNRGEVQILLASTAKFRATRGPHPSAWQSFLRTRP
jgi:hypothetical protein